MRKIQFANGEYYHIYNRGVDKRAVFNNNNDYERFFKSMKEFNVVEPIGSIYERSFSRSQFGSLASKLASGSVGLVKFICYCLNPNHYHFLVQQVADDGIKKFMHRIGTGYTKYFNEKYERNGSLFQGSYKIVHIDSNEYLLHLSAYINLNDKVHFSQHQLGSLASKLDFKSSWNDYDSAKNKVKKPLFKLDKKQPSKLFFKKIGLLFLVLNLFAFVSFSAYASSGAPAIISYQGRLTDSGAHE